MDKRHQVPLKSQSEFAANLPTRHFLGFKQPFLDALCTWVLSQAEDPSLPDLSNFLIVVQGARTARGLEQRLAFAADHAGVMLVPPLVSTPGNAPSMLFHKPSTHGLAEAFAVHAAWVAALEELEDGKKLVFGLENSRPFSSAQRDLAATLAAIDAELVAGCLDARRVAIALRNDPNAPERAARRWDVFGDVCDAAQTHLAGWALQDPSRRKAELSEHGALRPGLRLVLAGLPDFDPLFVMGFKRLADRCDVLILAEEGPGFDEWGRVVPEYWAGRKLELEGGRLAAPENSLAQAELIADWVARRKGSVIVAPDETEIPGLMDAMEARGQQVRASAAKPFSQTRPFRVLRLAARFLDRPQDSPPAFPVVAEMIRQQDFRARLGDLEGVLDEFQATHLPAKFEPSRYSAGDIPEKLLTLEKALKDLFPLKTSPHPIPELARFFNEVFLEIFGRITADDTTPDGRAILRPFKALYEEFAHLQACKIDVEIRPSDFLSMILDALEGGSVPAMSSGRETEIIGWLELLSEDAPSAAIASVCEGIVPASQVAHPFLPGGLRETLGLRPDKRRLARDAYILSTAARLRPGGMLVCAPRKSADGDPLRPSRILLQGFSGKSLATRLLNLFVDRAGEEPPGGETRTVRLQLPPIEPVAISSLSQSAFGAYLRSPKLFYFANALRLELPDDQAQEIDSLLGGSLLHAVLSQFVNDPSLRGLREEESIRRALFVTFESLFTETFAGLQPATVDFQKDALLEKLAMFARVQSELFSEGWKIIYAEKSTGPGDQLRRDLSLPDGNTVEIRGRIDRIDFHAPTGQWRVIDYKTGAKPIEPDKAHFTKTTARTSRNRDFACSPDGSTRWKGLQFPLYRWLLDQPGQELLPDWKAGTPADFHYFFLPEDPTQAGISSAFPEEKLPEGLEMAALIAQRILSGKFADNPDSLTQEDPIFRALCGLSNLVSDDEEEDGE